MARRSRGNSQRSVKGETVQDARDRKRRARKLNRRACVDFVRDRDRHHCRCCGRPVQYLHDSRDDFGEVHEYIFRSRGGSPVEPTNCVLVCKGCHTAVEPCIHPGIGHRSKRVIRPLDADRLMEGPIVSDVENFDDEQVDREHALAS